MPVTDGMAPVPEQDIRFGDPDAPPTPWAEALHVLETAELFWRPPQIAMAARTASLDAEPPSPLPVTRPDSTT